MYLIVEFVGEEQTGPVAKSWYEDGFSWWPPYKDENRLLKSFRKSEVPQPDKGWSKHSVRILYESESFDNIVANWKKSCYTSDLNSETELRNSSTETLGKRVRKKKIYSSSEQEEEPQPAKVKKLANAPRPPAPPQRQKHGSKNNAYTMQQEPSRWPISDQCTGQGQGVLPHVNATRSIKVAHVQPVYMGRCFSRDRTRPGRPTSCQRTHHTAGTVKAVHTQSVRTCRQNCPGGTERDGPEDKLPDISCRISCGWSSNFAPTTAR
ncbi:uncharacterized protein LOC134326808 isoform X4 [Trichomycterus rosablanca]|uniref:uncharacterized protein LOC134305713 isoform X4 n=1 Tax=Trichomycterus rosablanca TaxID=2290929 RepID=UPI002F35F8E6